LLKVAANTKEKEEQKQAPQTQQRPPANDSEMKQLREAETLLS
jgi:hypothetical protein